MKLYLLGIVILLALPTVLYAQPASAGLAVRAPLTSYCAASTGRVILVADSDAAAYASSAASDARDDRIYRLLSDAGWEGGVRILGSTSPVELASLTATTTAQAHPDLVVTAPPDVTMAWARSVVGPC